ncbi:MAG: CRISPR-associated ring nuclease Csm6 [Deltaproteobacteria bacterium]|nr:CRISPR-associated ring nuclease Csm6 [Deltaproteobacteria bacterium]MDZ4346771.1 CRISPR-associated ring nuclease Csm6 [Candidatus Binatia bacterium]
MRDVLIALCGLTPQVVTETLWALGQQRPAIVPEKVWIITTQSGREACERLLFGKTGKFASYFREYPPSRPIRCGPSTVITLKGSDGRPVEDLRTQEDNLAVADQLAARVRDLTALPNERLHCSVAGGRKTMGVLLASVLQVYGRPDDRLYHVLVSPDFESQPDFFYIPKRQRLLALPNGKRLDSRKACIELAEIPYVRLRAFLPEELLKQALPFTDLVALAQKHLRALERLEPVAIDTVGHRLIVGETVIELSPAQARLYTAFARIKTAHCLEPARKNCDACIACYRPISKANWDAVHTELENLAEGLLLSPADARGESGETAVGRFRSLLSKTNKALVKGLGSEHLAARYEIRSERQSGETRYGLAVDKNLIQLET